METSAQIIVKVSVIIPCRNSARHLAETLQSLVDQTWKEFEVVAVDDHSTDETHAILTSFQTFLTLRIVTPDSPLRSASASRNYGYAQSAGDYIKFLDSDDILSPDQMQLQWIALKQKGMDKVCVSGWSRFYHTVGERPVEYVESKASLPPVEWILRSMEAGHSMMQCGMFLIPRSLIEQSGLWRPEPAPTDDFEFFIRLLLNASSVIPTGGVLWYRSGQAGSLSRQSDAIHAQNAANRIVEALERLIACADSDRVRPLAGRVFIDWACTFFPQHREISERLELAARECGVNLHEAGGGRLIRLCSRIFGWKFARRLQYNVNRCGH
jgi:hypothetical protein